MSASGDGSGWRFGPAVEPHHERLDAGDFERIFVIGDVHGCVDELRALLDALEVGDDDLVLFVGDLVRKGPASAEVLALVRSRPHCRSVRGNNEAKLLDGTADPGLAPDDRAYLERLPLAISVGDLLVVHGGVDPRKPLAEQTPNDLLESRSLAPAGGYERPFWFERYEGPPRVFFGHTVLDRPYVGEWAVGLDTGCVHGGDLSAYDVPEGRVRSVPARTTYRGRSDDTVVSPGELVGRG